MSRDQNESRGGLVAGLIVCVMLLPGGLQAEFPDPGPDSFGLYAFSETDGWANCIDAPTGLLDLFIVLAGPGQDCIGAWGLSLAWDSLELIFLSAEYYGSGGNWEIPPDFMISLWDPLPVVEDHVVLAKLTFLIVVPQEMNIYAGPPPNSPLPRMPVYVNCTEPYVEVGCSFATDRNGEMTDLDGWLTVPLAMINDEDCGPWDAVATERTNWSALKEMYR